MNNDHLLNQIGITASHGNLYIDGYPLAKRICKVPTKLAQQLAELRLHAADLDLSSEAMQQLAALGQPSDAEAVEKVRQREILLTFALVKFCGCFGRSNARFRLSAEEIYKEKPFALEAYNYAVALRDKHIVHDDNNCHFSITCAVLDEHNTLMDIANLKSQFFPGWDFYQNLFTLIEDARNHVMAEALTVRQKVFDEVAALSSIERSQFLDVEHNFPVAPDISKTRKY